MCSLKPAIEPTPGSCNYAKLLPELAGSIDEQAASLAQLEDTGIPWNSREYHGIPKCLDAHCMIMLKLIAWFMKVTSRLLFFHGELSSPTGLEVRSQSTPKFGHFVRTGFQPTKLL